MAVIDTNEQTILQTPLFNVEDLRIGFSNGTERVYQRVRMKSPTAVMVIGATSRNTLIMIREFAAGVGDYILKFPTGGVKEGETVEYAARRELLEETGWIAGSLQVLRPIYADPGFCDQATFVVAASDLVLCGASGGDEPERPLVHEYSIIERDWLRTVLIDGRSLAALGMLGASIESLTGNARFLP